MAVFCLSGVNAGRAAVTLAGWELWSGFDLPFPLWLRAALSAAWAVVLAGMAWGLWVRQPWARSRTLVVFPLYQIYELGWLSAFARSDYQRGRLPFALATATAASLVVVWLLTRRRVRAAFEMTDGGTEGVYVRQGED